MANPGNINQNQRNELIRAVMDDLERTKRISHELVDNSCIEYQDDQDPHEFVIDVLDTLIQTLDSGSFQTNGEAQA